MEILSAGVFALTKLGSIPSVHRGAVLPAARVIVLLVPLGALAFYALVVRRRRR